MTMLSMNVSTIPSPRSHEKAQWAADAPAEAGEDNYK